MNIKFILLILVFICIFGCNNNKQPYTDILPESINFISFGMSKTDFEKEAEDLDYNYDCYDKPCIHMDFNKQPEYKYYHSYTFFFDNSEQLYLIRATNTNEVYDQDRVESIIRDLKEICSKTMILNSRNEAGGYYTFHDESEDKEYYCGFSYQEYRRESDNRITLEIGINMN